MYGGVRGRGLVAPSYSIAGSLVGEAMGPAERALVTLFGHESLVSLAVPRGGAWGRPAARTANLNTDEQWSQTTDAVRTELAGSMHGTERTRFRRAREMRAMWVPLCPGRPCIVSDHCTARCNLGVLEREAKHDMQRARLKQSAGLVVGASLLASTLGVGSIAFAYSGNPNYYDIGKLTPLAQRSIVTLYQEGIMNGTAPGKFSPYISITRAQAVKFVVNAMGLTLASRSTPATYSDVSVYSAYYPWIEAAVKAGILNGMAASSGDFNPSVPITREDMAVLTTNALGDQSLAQSLAGNLTKYGYIQDLKTVTPSDLGDVNAMMEEGIVPPYNAHFFKPFDSLNREEFAVAIFRLYHAIAAKNLTSATLSAATPEVGVGQADQLSVTGVNGQGQQLTASQLAAYTVQYSVVGPNSGSATISPNGSFAASAPGTYTVQVSISGNGLSSAVTATTQVQVFGTPAALKVMPKSTTIVADDAATDTIQVQVMDSAGQVVATYNGPVTLSDTNNATELVGSNGSPQSAAMTVNAVNGIATFTIQSTSGNGGATDTLTANATYAGQSLTAGSATITTVAQQATSVAVTAASNDLRANTGGNQDAINAVVDDQAGSPMLTGTYGLTFSLTGPSQFTDGATTMEQAFIANGTANPNPAQVDIVSQQGATGPIDVTVSGSGLTSGQVTVQSVIAGAPQAMKLSAASPSVASGVTDPITVALVDSNGVPTTTASAIPVSATISQGGSQVGTLSGTIAAGGGSTTLNFSEVAAGTYSVTVSAAGFPSVSLNIAVTSGAASALSLSPSGPTSGAPVELAQGNESVKVAAQLVDANGNPVTQSGVPVTFTAAGGSGSYTVNGTQGSATVDTGSNGTASATFDFGTSTGTWTVTAASSGLTSATQAFEVVPYAATAVNVSINQTGPVTAGSTVSGVITAEQPNGTADQNADYLQVAVSPSAGLQNIKFTDPAKANAAITPTSSQNGVYLVQSTDGQIDFSATAGQAGTVTVKATDESVASTPSGSASIGINASTVPGGAVAYDSQGNNLSSTPLSVSANQAVAISVRLTDGFGNAVVSDVPVTVQLQDMNGTASGGGNFRSSPQGANFPNNEITIPAGSPGVTVYYVNATAGSYTINALTPGLMTGVSSKAGSAGAGTITLNFANLPSGGSITADTDAAHWTVDVNGQTLPSSDYTVASSGQNVTFTLSAGYVSGKAFSVAQAAGNTSATNAGIPLSLPSAAFNGQSLS